MIAEATVQQVEIRPEVNILSVLRHLNYRPWFALSEFVDNALQSYLGNERALKALHGDDYQLTVKIRIDSGFPGVISISDNAAGISAIDFPRAFRAAQPPHDARGLSEFGMGMKSAACWFAQRWSVRTKALGESVERTLEFDIEKILGEHLDVLTSTSQDAPIDDHYTVVKLMGLHHSPQGKTVAKIKNHLAAIYRLFIADGRLILKVNGEPLAYACPKVLVAPAYDNAGTPKKGAPSVEWTKGIAFDVAPGLSVRGFAAIRETGSTPLAGFALFRRGRLIQGSHDEAYRPSAIFKQTNSYRYQRIFGELHFDGFEVSHTKDGFRWEEYEETFLSMLKSAMEDGDLNLLHQADNYRALPQKRTIEDQASEATDSVADYLKDEVEPLIQEARADDGVEPEDVPRSLDANALQASERVVVLDDGLYAWTITLRTSTDPAVDDWASLAKDTSDFDQGSGERSLVIDLALAHPFSSRFIGPQNENIELMLRFAAAVCVALVLTEDQTGESPSAFLYFFNTLLRGTLARNV